MPTATDRYDELFARTYDQSYEAVRTPSGDVDFYRDLARENGGPVLELGCGTGRTLLPIARDGVPCVGVDPSPSMLAVLRGKGVPEHLELVESSWESLDLGGRRFRLVTAPFRVFSHLLDVDQQLAGLDRVRRHLAPGGLFAFDLFDPNLERIAAAEEAEHLSLTCQVDGIELRRYDRVRRDHSRQVMEVGFRFEGGPPGCAGETSIHLRWYYRYELEHLLARAGFANLRFYGGFDRRPWQAGGETIVLACARS